MNRWRKSKAEIMNEDCKLSGSQDTDYSDFGAMSREQASELLIDKARRVASSSETDPIPAEERWLLHTLADHIARQEADIEALNNPDPFNVLLEP
ncbi:hypothetical protein KUV57_11255 [Epibacterium sp. DP7N7-1]|nr:hypothetical protein [Epibacterium sp. DP7N7-1]